MKVVGATSNKVHSHKINIHNFKERYLWLKRQGKLDTYICESVFNISVTTLWRLKKEFGIERGSWK